MKIITLTTDFGLRDYWVGALKGAIFSQLNDVQIVDISHQVAPSNVLEAAYLLKNAYQYFPKGSIHIIGVDAEKTPKKKHLILQLNGHYFIGADNGIMSLLAENQADSVFYELSEQKEILFPELNVFVKVATDILKNIPITDFAFETANYLKVSYLKPIISTDNNSIKGSVIHIDHYGNAISDITQTLFDQVRKNRSFEIIFKMYSFSEIYERYNDVFKIKIDNKYFFNKKISVFDNTKNQYNDFANEENDETAYLGHKYLIFNSLGNIQLNIYKSDLNKTGGASSLLGVEIGNEVVVRFR